MMTSCLHCQQSGKGGTGKRPLLEKLLPEGYVHLVCSYEETAQAQFRAHIKLRVTSEDEVHKWLKDFQTSSGLVWRKSKTYPNTGRYNAYRVDLRCQHNTYSKTVGKKTKNTSCSATMYLVLKRHQFQDRKSRSGDPHIKDGYLLNVNLRHEHNHGLSCADAAAKRDVSGETIAKLKTLFESGHTPSSALNTIKFDLRKQEGDNYIHAAADHSICPDVQFCYRLYHKLFQRAGSEAEESDDVKVGPGQGASVENLEEMIQQVCRSLTDKLKHDPQTFTAPIQTFIGTYNKLNDSSLTSALQGFGKAPQVRSKKVRRAVIPGRPLKSSRTEQHPYSKTQPCRKSPSHSVSECVEDSSLGGVEHQ